ncbi:hypothetical protein BX600DRAFT_509813 [Xylariales sp. PMI_506]|nr:hypothetical protein BX600DRAFT_509813 [Xylariales sp. PMI_506]
MASSLQLLKGLACPAGKNCTAFQCLFKHDVEADAQLPAVAKSDHSQSKTTHPTDENQDSPRKRLKVAPSSPASLQHSTITEKKSELNIKMVKPVRTVITPKTAKTAEEQPKQPQKNGNIAATPRTPAGSSKQSPSNATSTAKTAPKKPETLNPRHLKRAPAKHDIRWQLVKLLHAQYSRLNSELKKLVKGGEVELIMTDQDLITRTLDDEEDIAIKKHAIYGNVLKNKIMSYKRMSVDKWREERVKVLETTNGGAAVSKDSQIVIETGLNQLQEVDFLHRLSMDMKGLERFGYIATIPEDGDIEKAKEAVRLTGNREICDRCTERFRVFPGRREADGALADGGTCLHHPGKQYFVERALGDRSEPEKKFRCCNQSSRQSNGCMTSSNHVFKTTDPNRLASVLNFVETPPNPNAPADRAVCFDCEMGYTVYGMELIRLTAVSWPSGEELLDVLVYPVGEYIDLNTRWSGVRPEDIAEAERWKPGDDPTPTIIPSADLTAPPQRKLKLVPSPKDARDLFFSLISPNTPLVGHGLENDLSTLRIIHPVIVDTVLLFPHKRGLPIRNSLKWLVENFLNRKIQVDDDQDNPQGHDSGEDARAAGDLVKLKVRDEWKKMKLQGWTVAKDGSLQPPDGGEWTVVSGKKTK